jgi:hypothetical protein
VNPVSAALDVKYFGSDTTALLMTALRCRSKLRIVDFDEAIRTNHSFILAAEAREYVPWHLVAAGYRVTPMHSAAAPLLYRVEAPDLDVEPGRTRPQTQRGLH